MASTKTGGHQPRPAESALRNLGVTLVLLRRFADKNQEEVARAAGIGQPQLSAYEAGRKFPRIETLERVLGVLGVTPLGFFFAMDRVDRVLVDLVESGQALPDPLIPTGNGPGNVVFQRVVAELLRLGRLGRGRGRES
jgi:transcriptional regulator with XRE-family HTH domain